MRDGWPPDTDAEQPVRRPATARVPPAPGYPRTTDGVWQPEAGAGSLIGGALLIVAVLVAAVAGREVATTPGAVRLLWLAVAVAAVVAATWLVLLLLRLRSLRYILGPDRLIVQRRGLVIAIPYHAIDGVILRPRDRIEIAGYERFWPGYYDALAATSEGPWRSLATTPPNRRVRIHSGHSPVLAISPARPVLFVEALESRRRAAGGRPAPAAERPAPAAEPVAVDMPAVTARPARSVPDTAPMPEPAAPESRAARTERPRPQLPSWLASPVAWRIFRERIVRGDALASNLLALDLIALIVLVTLTVWRADAVGSPVAVRWNAAGDPVQWVRAEGFWVFEGVWLFPVTAAAIIVINAALSTFAVIANRLREARMLLAAPLPVEVILMVALWQTTS